MKRIEFNKKYIEICLYTLAVILLSLVFGRIIWNISDVSLSIGQFFGSVHAALAPFIYGLFIAYFMNATMRFLEKKVFSRIDWFRTRSKKRRSVAVASTYLIYIGCFALVFSFLIPGLVDNVRSLWDMIRTAWEDNQDAFNHYFGPESELVNFFSSYHINVEIINRIPQWMENANIDFVFDFAHMVLIGTVSFASTIVNFLIGVVVAFYMLCDKEHYAKLLRKILVIFFRKPSVDRFLKRASSSNRIIEKFIVGKAIESLVIATMFFLVALFIGPDYILLLTVIVGATNMVTYIGPIIGSIICALIVLPTDPAQAMLIVLVIFAIQQFNNFYLGPKILGDSTGLPPLLVIFAIFIGGAIAGVPGMFFGVPVLAIIRNILSEVIDKRYTLKHLRLKQAGGENP